MKANEKLSTATALIMMTFTVLYSSWQKSATSAFIIPLRRSSYQSQIGRILGLPSPYITNSPRIFFPRNFEKVKTLSTHITSTLSPSPESEVIDEPQNFETITLESSFLQTMRDRGFLHQCTNIQDLDKQLAMAQKEGSVFSAYLGFDATANSLHVGSLLQIMILEITFPLLVHIL